MKSSGHGIKEKTSDGVYREICPGSTPHVLRDSLEWSTQTVDLILVRPVRSETLHDFALGSEPVALGVDQSPVHVEEDRSRKVDPRHASADHVALK